jgi:hypothetical protein
MAIGICNLLKHWKAQNGIHVVLIGRNVTKVSVKHLSNRENTGSFGVGTPELLANMLDRVDANPVELVLIDKICDPVVQRVDDFAVF